MIDVKRARSMMEEAGLDALVATSPENVYYSSGSNIVTMFLLGRLGFVVLPLDGEPVFGVSSIEVSKAEKTSWIRDVKTYEGADYEPIKGIEFLTKLIEEKGLGKSKVGIDRHFLPSLYYDVLCGGLPDVEFVDNQAIYDHLRAVKSPKEVKHLTEANMAIARAITEAFEMAKEGDTEREIAKNMGNLVVEYGADNVVMCVLSSGETAFEAHHLPVDKKIRKGELVNTDFVASFDGYCSDIARMAVVGEPDSTQEKIYRLALEVQEKVAEAMAPGGRVIEAYDAAVKTVARAGYEFYLPFVGHSMGIALHENPFVGPSHGDWNFEPGMFFQIEPLLMYEGVRVHTEDSILVTEDGAKNISRYADISEIQVIR